MSNQMDDPLQELAGLLAVVGARPSINRSRVAPSTLYDANYHVAMIACAFAMHSRPDSGGHRSILAPWLKMLQFVAARPQLADDLRTWIATRRVKGGLLSDWSRMPRGYLGDSTHDATVDFLAACHVLVRYQDQLQAGPRVHIIDNIYKQIDAEQLFLREREVLRLLVGVKPSKTMLGGQ